MSSLQFKRNYTAKLHLLTRRSSQVIIKAWLNKNFYKQYREEHPSSKYKLVCRWYSYLYSWLVLFTDLKLPSTNSCFIIKIKPTQKNFLQKPCRFCTNIELNYYFIQKNMESWRMGNHLSHEPSEEFLILIWSIHRCWCSDIFGLELQPQPEINSRLSAASQ